MVLRLTCPEDFALGCTHAAVPAKGETWLPIAQHIDRLCETRDLYDLPEAHVLEGTDDLWAEVRLLGRRQLEQMPPLFATTPSLDWRMPEAEFSTLADRIRATLNLPSWVPIDPGGRFGGHRMAQFHLAKGSVHAALRWQHWESLLVSPALRDHLVRSNVLNEFIPIRVRSKLASWTECVARWAPHLQEVAACGQRIFFKVVNLNGIYVPARAFEAFDWGPLWPVVPISLQEIGR